MTLADKGLTQNELQPNTMQVVQVFFIWFLRLQIYQELKVESSKYFPLQDA